MDLLDDLPRGRDSKHIGTPPHSYFESPRNLAATESLHFDPRDNLAAKMFLGVVGGKVITGDRLSDGRISRYVKGGVALGVGDDRHRCLLAAGRSGKARAGLLPVVLSMPADVSLFILDPKGEISHISARYRAQVLRQHVGILDPFKICHGNTANYRIAFNAIELLNNSDKMLFVPNAKLIADALIVSTEYQETRHWDDSSKQILTGLCLHVATHPRYEGIRDLVTVWRLACELASIDPTGGGYWLEKEMLENDAADGYIRLSCRQFYDRTGGEFTSVASNLRRQIDWMGIPCMRDCLTGPSFDLRSQVRRPTTFTIAIPGSRMVELSGLMRLLTQMTFGMLEEEFNRTGKVTRRLYALLDEFHILGKLSILEVAAAQFSNLLTMVIVLQDLGQLQSRYAKSWETFLGNSGVIQVFGLNDYTTQQYISRRLGETLTLTRSTNMPGYEAASQHAATGESWSLGVHPLLNPEEVGRFFARDDSKLRQLILRPGYRPAVIQRAYYDKHEFFQGRFDE